MKRTNALFLAGMLACTVFLTSCSNSAIGGKVATVDGTPITRSAYDKTYQEFQKAFYVGNIPENQKAALADTLKRMTINKLIFQTLIYNEAAKNGVTVSSADVDSYKKNKIFKDPAVKQQFQQFLTQNKMQESEFDAMLKDNLLVNKLMESKAGPELAVTDAEIKSTYEKNKEQFKLPERIHASHILISAIEPQLKKEFRAKNPKITDAELSKAVAAQKAALKQQAEKILAEVKANPAKFEDLAKADSQDPGSAKQGGDLGFMVQNSTDPAFWTAIEKTPAGQLDPTLVSSQFGYHIVKVLEHAAPHTQSFEESKGMIKERLSQMKKQAFMQKWAEEQKAVAKISVEPAYQPKETPVAPPASAAMPIKPEAAAAPAQPAAKAAN